MVLEGVPARKIHRALYDETIRSKRQYADKALLAMAIKTANRASKFQGPDASGLILDLFLRKSDKAAKHIINHDAQKIAESEKNSAIKTEIAENRAKGKWFYLASSHNDCAKDHLEWQGKLYVDAEAPEEVLQYAKARELYTVQYVMDSPAWLITRPNCRHYFVALTEKEVRGSSMKELKKRHHTHTPEGDRDFQTPARRAVEEYEDRLRLLRALYRERPFEKLKNEIQKAEMLLKKWKKEL